MYLHTLWRNHPHLYTMAWQISAPAHKFVEENQNWVENKQIHQTTLEISILRLLFCPEYSTAIPRSVTLFQAVCEHIFLLPTPSLGGWVKLCQTYVVGQSYSIPSLVIMHWRCSIYTWNIYYIGNNTLISLKSHIFKFEKETKWRLLSSKMGHCVM